MDIRTCKIVTFILLAGLCIILSSTLVALQLMYVQKEITLLDNYNERQTSILQNQDDASQNEFLDNSSDSFQQESAQSSSKTKTSTIQTSLPLNLKTDIFIRQRLLAPSTTQSKTAADAHLGEALRLIPFESPTSSSTTHDDSNDDVDSSHSIHGNALPPHLLHSEFGNGRGVQFVQDYLQLKPYRNSKLSMSPSTSTTTTSNSIYSTDDSKARRKGGLLRMIRNKIRKYQSMTNRNTDNYNLQHPTMNSKNKISLDEIDHDEPMLSFYKEKQALHHLISSSELGNSYAQNMIANALASGILPVSNHPKLVSTLFNSTATTSTTTKLNTRFNIPSDFSEGGAQLARALILWHMSAMDGNIESAMAMGYRHYFSAMQGMSASTSMNEYGSLSNRRILFNKNLKQSYRNHNDRHHTQSDPTTTTSTNDNILLTTDKITKTTTSTVKNSPSHDPSPFKHYGVIGTCESAMLYYEAAANAIMDELETGPLRGKVNPAVDAHKLVEIHQRGGSAALSLNNKPDELEEAIKFYKMKASRKNAEPNVGAAYKVASMYHYGLRGVKQDMRMALKYYEIGADFHSWEAAGQAGKFHFWGIGLEDHERDLRKAYRYFSMGAPGGIQGCKRRMKAKKLLDQKLLLNSDSDDWFVEHVSLCDHPSVNGMGLLHLFGIPMLVPVNLTLAIEYFNLAKEMGNMDAFYNLGMLRLGWMNPHYINTNNNNPIQPKLHNQKSPTRADVKEAINLFIQAAEMGHMQAKHRLAMIYARGFHPEAKTHNSILIEPNCQKALHYYRDIANSGTTVTRRLRAAYKQYIAKDYESSLRNYLAAAETGSAIAQVNAAFLMEQGHCLGMKRSDCLKASLRMWRAAAHQDNEEALLRVGDFYYYGRLGSESNILDDESNNASDGYVERRKDYLVSPFSWFQFVLYPEDLIPLASMTIRRTINWIRSSYNPKRKQNDVEKCTKNQHTTDYEPMTCSNVNDGMSSKSNDRKQNQEINREYQSIAAQFYRKAIEEHTSARAHFNLGFMHEWGLGLTQDFPLAKRHYDMAIAEASGEGVVPAQIALFCMNIHEFLVKMGLWVDNIIEKGLVRRLVGNRDDSMSKNEPLEQSVDMDWNKEIVNLLVKHLLSWESAVIVILTFILVLLMNYSKKVRNKRARR